MRYRTPFRSLAAGRRCPALIPKLYPEPCAGNRHLPPQTCWQETCDDAFHPVADYSDLGPARRTAVLALQPRLGLWPIGHPRPGAGRGLDHGADGPHASLAPAITIGASLATAPALLAVWWQLPAIPSASRTSRQLRLGEWAICL